MRVLLVHNSLYYPSYGGGDKSNRLLMQALAASGHTVRVVARLGTFGTEPHERLLRELACRGIHPKLHDPSIQFELQGVDVRVLTRIGHLRHFLTGHIHAFDPDVILTSTDDPAQFLFEIAMSAERPRVVYLIRATVALPFGPDSWSPNETKTQQLRHAEGAVGVSEYVAEYARRWGGLDAIHVPISLLDERSQPFCGNFNNRFVTIVNPCAVKGISILLGLADRMRDTEFAAVPSWGTTDLDLAELRKRPNISILPPVENIDELYRVTRVALVPSLWAEARSRVILEAMARGIPVLASDVGGLREAKLGVDYLLPVNRVERFQTGVNELMVPVADIPLQNIGPWERALRSVVTDRTHYERVASESRETALRYAANLTSQPFEDYLEAVLERPRNPRHAVRHSRPLSSDKHRLLTTRLRRLVQAKSIS